MSLGYLVGCLAVCLATCSCDGMSPRERAETYGATACVSVSIVDESMQVVSNANFEVYYDLSVREGKTVKGRSDVAGRFKTLGKTTGDILINVNKTGYYPSEAKIKLAADENREVRSGWWLPREVMTNIVLRKIGRPIKLKTQSLSENYPILNSDEVIGFDLEVLDWIKPHGKGKTVDFVVKYHSDGKKLFEYTGAKLDVRFVRPFDGAYKRTFDKVSKLRTEPIADTNAVFLTELKFWEEVLPNKQRIGNKLGKDEYLVLRTRSKVDAKGNFIGGHYALILGDWSFGWSTKSFGHMGFKSYYNPTFNDPNLEEMNIFNTPNFRTTGGLPKTNDGK